MPKLYKGCYIRRLDRKTFNNGSSFIEISFFCQHKNYEMFVNNKTKINLNEVEVLSKEQYEKALTQKRVFKEEKEEDSKIKIGSHVRRVDWDCFYNGLPILVVHYIHENVNTFNINGHLFSKNSLVLLKKEEAVKLLDEFNSIKLVLGSSSERSCFTKHNEPKKSLSMQDAFKIVFKNNKKYQSKIEAYICNICGNIHVGHLE